MVSGTETDAVRVAVASSAVAGEVLERDDVVGVLEVPAWLLVSLGEGRGALPVEDIALSEARDDASVAAEAAGREMGEDELGVPSTSKAVATLRERWGSSVSAIETDAVRPRAADGAVADCACRTAGVAGVLSPCPLGSGELIYWVAQRAASVSSPGALIAVARVGGGAETPVTAAGVSQGIEGACALGTLELDGGVLLSAAAGAARSVGVQSSISTADSYNRAVSERCHQQI